MYTSNRRRKSLNVQKSVRSKPILAFLAHVLEIDNFHENPKKSLGNPPANMTNERYLTGDYEETSPFEASVEGQNGQRIAKIE